MTEKYTKLMDIVDEALDLIEVEIEEARTLVTASTLKKFIGDPGVVALDRLNILKDIRDILKLSENFRDE